MNISDSESIEHHDEYEGKRIKRGLFRSSEGTIINADVNGAYNIGRKAFPNLFRSEGIEASGLKPRSLSIGQMITSKGVC
jgi:putative transposase